MIKLVLGLSLLLSLIAFALANDYFYDEEGRVYTIGPFGDRRYEGLNNNYDNNIKKNQINAENILKFGWKLFQNIENDNFVVSPISPQILLSCLIPAVKNGSSSHAELKNIVRYKDPKLLEELVINMLNEETTRDLKIGTAFFMKNDPKVKKAFFDDERSQHNFDVRNGESQKSHRPLDVVYVNFSDPRAVNNEYRDWVSRSTNGVIKSADLEIDSETKMILASTIYFKGQWLFAFNKTEEADFTLPSGEVVKINSMKMKKKFYAGKFSDIEARWAAVPYNSTEALVIILPNENTNVDEVIKKMKGTELKEIIDDITGHPSSNWVNINLPKFKLDSKIDLKNPLNKMGINQIFSPQSELYLYDDDVQLRVGAAMQHSSLEVDEKGSIGASATAFSVVALTIEREKQEVEFNINRPFIAVIIDRKYGVPYFIGKITDPRQQS